MTKESKREKFVRLAEARTNKIIDMVALLGNCSNKNVYEYSEQDIEKIFNAIDRELRDAKRKFESSGKSSKIKFSLQNS